MRLGPKLGLSDPSLTLPASAVLAGAARIGPKLGLSEPSRTLPESSTSAGAGQILSVIFGSFLRIIASNSLSRHHWRRPFDASMGYLVRVFEAVASNVKRLLNVAKISEDPALWNTL